MKNSSILRTIIIVLVLVAIVGISKQNSDDSIDNIEESYFATNPNWSQHIPTIKFVENNNYKAMIRAEDFNYTNMTISINTTYITNISTDGDIMNIHIR